MSDAQGQFEAHAASRVGSTFVVFALTILPILVGPRFMADVDWFRSIDWPLFTPLSKFWAIGFLLSHILVAYGVATEWLEHQNRFTVLLWGAQLVLTWVFVLVFFVGQNLMFASISEFLLAMGFLVAIFIARTKWYLAAVTYLPAAAYCGFAAYILINTI